MNNVQKGTDEGTSPERVYLSRGNAAPARIINALIGLSVILNAGITRSERERGKSPSCTGSLASRTSMSNRYF